MYRKRQTYTPSTGTNTQLGCYTEMSSGNINLQKKNSLTKKKKSGKELTLPSAKTVETTRSCYREESAPPMVFINTISILVLSHPRQLSVNLALTWQVKKKKKNTLATNEARWGRGTDMLPCRGQSPDITIRPTLRIFKPIKKIAQLATADELLATACKQQRTMVGHWPCKANKGAFKNRPIRIHVHDIALNFKLPIQAMHA